RLHPTQQSRNHATEAAGTPPHRHEPSDIMTVRMLRGNHFMNLRKLAACCFLTVLAGVLTAAAQDRIVQPVDSTRMTALKGQVHPRALPENDRGPVSPTMPIHRASLLFKAAPGLI